MSRQWDHSHEVNPRPATGPGVLTVDQLKFYLREIRHNPDFGVCGVYGGWQAFLRFCGECAHYAQHRLVRKDPRANWIPARVQRTLSRKVRQLLAGEVIFVCRPGKRATWELPTSPQPLRVGVTPRTYNMRVERTPFGFRVARLPTDF